LYAYVDNKIYYTTNVGLSWTDISIPNQYCNNLNDFIINNSIPFAAACGSGQVVKLDVSQNWVLSNSGLAAEPLAFARCEGALFVYLKTREMYVSFDNGVSWFYAGYGLSTNWSIRDFATKGSYLFVTSEYGVFATNDFGQHWVSMNDGLKNMNASSIKILNDTIYVGTFGNSIGTEGNGIWKRRLPDIYIPTSDESLHIYPNPASDYIHIAGTSGNAKFKISDMFGNIILSGSFNVNTKINVSGLKCGIYIVYTQFDNQVQTAKLLISR
jgi:hypothetical protein